MPHIDPNSPDADCTLPARWLPGLSLRAAALRDALHSGDRDLARHIARQTITDHGAEQLLRMLNQR